MPVLRSSINTKSETFIANAEHMQAQVNDLLEKIEQICQGGVKKRRSATCLEENFYLATESTH